MYSDNDYDKNIIDKITKLENQMFAGESYNGPSFQ